MKKFLFPMALAGSLALSGCAAGMGGDPLAGVLGSILGGNSAGQSGSSEFERAAVDACGREASRYGRVSIASVRQADRNTLLVEGSVETNNRTQRRFACSFRSDGEIVDFRIS